jgi:putative ferrous iron transport protein C
MILIQLKQYLQNQRTLSLFDITSRFNIDAEIARDMLQLWVNKGKVRKSQKTNQCGTQCSKCHPFIRELYEWVGEPV